MSKDDNPMRSIKLSQVTVNMGVGEPGEELKRAVTVLEQVTDAKPVQTKCKVKQPTWGIREGLPIGTKVTLRGAKAEKFIKEALSAKDHALKKKNFDRSGNFGFGIKEHIDLPGVKYDPKLGIRGMDVLVSLSRPGFRIKKRKLAKKKVTGKHAITKEEASAFVSQKYGVEIK